MDEREERPERPRFNTEPRLLRTLESFKWDDETFGGNRGLGRVAGGGRLVVTVVTAAAPPPPPR
jgi:hypothetical protein